MNFLNKGMQLFGNNDSDSGSLSNPIAMFRQLDRNGDGKITEDDFVAAIEKLGLGSIGETAVRQIFKQLDKNKNGKLDMSEAWSAFEQVKGLFDKMNAGAN